jgi:tetratricopeptide (TPR) repeat protein
MSLRLVSFALVAAILGAAPRIARADGIEEARKLVAEAQTHYKLGRFQEALDLYARAYELHKAPGFFFNMAQCHFQLKRWERAIFFYESYLREKPEAPNRAVVEQLIGEARRHLEGEDTQRRAEEQRRRDEEARRAEEERRAAAAAEEARLTEASERPRGTPAYKTWWFWATVGGAAALVAGGAAYYFSGDTTRVPPEGSLGLLDLR